MRRIYIFYLAFLLVICCTNSCSVFMTSENSLDPSVINMAEGEANRLKAQYGVLYPNDYRMTMVTQAEQKLSTAVRAYLKKRNKEYLLTNLRYELIVLNSTNVDCYSVGAGKVIIYAGLLDHLTSPDEIAVMIAHTLAHEVMRHSYKRLNSPLLAQLGSTLIAGTVSEADQYKQLYLSAFGITSSAFGGMKFTEKEEVSADDVMLLWVAKAGFNPKATMTVLTKLEDLSKQGHKISLLEIHPTSEKNRIHIIQYSEKYFNEYYLPQMR